MSEERPKINLRFWQADGELAKLAQIGDTWGDKVQEWLNWLGLQTDVETAPLVLVNLIAWQRDITRFRNEPEELYRKRIKHAHANAKDSGSKAGFARIWARLELGEIGQRERLDGQDFDIIDLDIDEGLFEIYPELLEIIIRQYGRTCRRYALETSKTIGLYVGAGEFCIDCETLTAQ